MNNRKRDKREQSEETDILHSADSFGNEEEEEEDEELKEIWNRKKFIKLPPSNDTEASAQPSLKNEEEMSIVEGIDKIQIKDDAALNAGATSYRGTRRRSRRSRRSKRSSRRSKRSRRSRKSRRNRKSKRRM